MGPNLISGLVGMLSRFFNVPVGASLRKEKERGKENQTIAQHELVLSVVSITVDDVCIGNSPVFLASDRNLNRKLKEKAKALEDELNSIAKWAAFDLLAFGVSSYKIHLKDGKLFLLPVVKDLDYYLSETKRVIPFDGQEEMTDCLVFINYNKASLEEVERSEEFSENFKEEKLNYKITPSPVQLSNIAKSVKELSLIEMAMQRYRRDTKLIRYITVDVGGSQGEKISEVTDNISNGINADSTSLEETNLSEYFNDEIPVFPTKGEKGKPNIVEYKPDVNLTEMFDMDHVLSKVFLGMRFPKSYADFSTTLDATAVSMIRGDVRYSRMIKQVRTLLEDTMNRFTSSVPVLKSYGVQFKLVEMPTPEDEEVVNSLTLYGDFIRDIYTFIVDESETLTQASYKVNLIEKLLGKSTSLKSVKDWIAEMREAIKDKFSETQPSEDPKEGSESEGFSVSSSDFSGLESDEPNIDSDEGFEEDVPEVDDEETIE